MKIDINEKDKYVLWMAGQYWAIDHIDEDGWVYVINESSQNKFSMEAIEDFATIYIELGEHES